MIKKIFNCISIHNGGGITYLSLMHHEIDKKDNIVFLDHRAKKLVKPFLNAEIIYFKRNLFRNLFVLKERIKYNFNFRRNLNKYDSKEYFKEYYLNGIPPFFRFPISTNKVFILFQNKNLFSYLDYFDKSLFFKFSFVIYHIIHFILIKAFLKNTDYIIVQTKSMKKTILSLRPKNKIFIHDNYWKNLTLEFYNQNIVNNYQNNIDLYIINRIKELSKVNKIFFYPSSFDPHKNHKLLFKTFNQLSRCSRNKIKLIVTIDKDKVPTKYRDNNLIYFIGNQPLQIINEIYKIVDFLLYPSLNESLGLPLIEASLHELPIIASNLDYVYDVCNPKLTFNPLSNKDLYNKIFDSLN